MVSPLPGLAGPLSPLTERGQLPLEGRGSRGGRGSGEPDQPLRVAGGKTRETGKDKRGASQGPRCLPEGADEAHRACGWRRDQHGESAGLRPPRTSSTVGVEKEDSVLSAQGTPDPGTLLDSKTKY